MNYLKKEEENQQNKKKNWFFLGFILALVVTVPGAWENFSQQEAALEKSAVTSQQLRDEVAQLRALCGARCEPVAAQK